jgi:hypothetical protein
MRKFNVVLERQAWDKLKIIIEAEDQEEAEDIANDIAAELDTDFDGAAACAKLQIVCQNTVSDDGSWELNNIWEHK